ncbi:hypothetical protein V6N13_086558 [Hibiscus sabdariffa]
MAEEARAEAVVTIAVQTPGGTLETQVSVVCAVPGGSESTCNNKSRKGEEEEDDTNSDDVAYEADEWIWHGKC